MASTIDRINQLSGERLRLTGEATNGHRGDPAVLQRIAAISRELEALWEERRRERVGQREGIDRVVDSVYAATYGRDFEDAVAPPAVAEPEAERLAVAA